MGDHAQATDRVLARWPVGEPISLRPHAQAITLEVIVRAVFGVHEPEPHEHLRALVSGVLDRPTRVRRMVLIAALGPEARGSSRCSGASSALDAQLHRLIAERRTAPTRARDDVLSTPLLVRDEDGDGLSDAELATSS